MSTSLSALFLLQAKASHNPDYGFPLCTYLKPGSSFWMSLIRTLDVCLLGFDILSHSAENSLKISKYSIWTFSNALYWWFKVIFTVFVLISNFCSLISPFEYFLGSPENLGCLHCSFTKSEILSKRPIQLTWGMTPFGCVAFMPISRVLPFFLLDYCKYVI